MSKLTDKMVQDREHYLAVIISNLNVLEFPVTYANIGRYDFLVQNGMDTGINRETLLNVKGNKAESARRKFKRFHGVITDMMGKQTAQRIQEKQHHLLAIISELNKMDIPVTYANIGRYDFLVQNGMDTGINRETLLNVKGNKAESARQKFVMFRSVIDELRDTHDLRMFNRIVGVLDSLSMPLNYANLGIVNHLITNGHEVNSDTISHAKFQSTKRQNGQYHYRRFMENRSSES